MGYGYEDSEPGDYLTRDEVRAIKNGIELRAAVIKLQEERQQQQARIWSWVLYSLSILGIAIGMMRYWPTSS